MKKQHFYITGFELLQILTCSLGECKKVKTEKQYSCVELRMLLTRTAFDFQSKMSKKYKQTTFRTEFFPFLCILLTK